MSLIALFILLGFALLVYMTLWFELAQYLKRVDVVDSAWGLGFVYMAVLTLVIQGTYYAVQVAASALVVFWGLRLFTHITARNMHKAEDARYAAFRTKWGEQFLRKAYTNIYLVQGALILLISTPIIAIESTATHQWTKVVIFGFLVWLFGIGFESLADYQLRGFLKTRTDKQAVMQSGLWHYSRHPNYFGEVTTWVGAAIVAYGVGRWWGFIGAAVIAFLIIKISGIPPLEKHYANHKNYQAYKKRTSVFLPLPPKQL